MIIKNNFKNIFFAIIFNFNFSFFNIYKIYLNFHDIFKTLFEINFEILLS